jgi:hypothetical protein
MKSSRTVSIMAWAAPAVLLWGLVVTDHGRRGRPQQRQVERRAQRPFIPAPKGRAARLVRSDIIRVTASGRVESRVKIPPHLERGSDPNVRRQHRVQCAPQLRGGPLGRESYSDRLSSRVDPCVGAPGAEGGHGRVAQPAQGTLELALDSAYIRLPLPTRESAPIVMQDKLMHALAHGGKLPAAKLPSNVSSA